MLHHNKNSRGYGPARSRLLSTKRGSRRMRAAQTSLGWAPTPTRTAERAGPGPPVTSTCMGKDRSLAVTRGRMGGILCIKPAASVDRIASARTSGDMPNQSRAASHRAESPVVRWPGGRACTSHWARGVPRIEPRRFFVAILQGQRLVRDPSSIRGTIGGWGPAWLSAASERRETGRWNASRRRSGVLDARGSDHSLGRRSAEP